MIRTSALPWPFLFILGASAGVVSLPRSSREPFFPPLTIPLRHVSIPPRRLHHDVRPQLRAHARQQRCHRLKVPESAE